MGLKKMPTKYTVTVIHADGNSKFLKSTNEDPKIFDFENLTAVSLREVLMYMATHYILNFPISSDHRHLKSRRSGDDLRPHLAETTNYVVLDFDGLTSPRQIDEIHRILKTYNHIIVKSRSYNGISNFNAKGLIQVSAFTPKDCRNCLNWINETLAANGMDIQADLSSARSVQYTAPIKRFDPLHEIMDGSALRRDLLRDYKETKRVISYHHSMFPLVHDLFLEIGFNDTWKTMEAGNYEYQGDGRYNWYCNSPFMMYHLNPSKNVSIKSEFLKRYNYKDFIIKTPQSDLLKYSNNKGFNKIQYSEFKARFIDEEGDLDYWNEWKLNGGVYFIKSAMGTGKTRMIKKATDNCISCLVITPRVSLAVELAHKLEMGCYLSDDLRTNKIVCQFDSLFKLERLEYDYVVIDEYMTLEAHIVAQNKNRGSAPYFVMNNLQRLANYIRNPKSKVLIMDALLTEASMDIFKRQTLYYMTNNYRDPTALMTHKTFESFLKEMSTTHKRRITVSCVSKSKLFGLSKFLGTCGHRVAIISAEQSALERQDLIKKFEDGIHTCLCFTPTISVGISLDSEVDRHFHYDPGNVVTAVQSIQMMRRSRRSRQIDCFIGSAGIFNSLCIDEIQTQLRQDKNLSAACKMNVHGDVSLTDAGELFAWMSLHNNVFMSGHKQAFELLASFNFHIKTDVEVPGSRDFKGFKLPEIEKHSGDWTEELQEWVASNFGDYLTLIQQYVMPNEVKDFYLYSEIRKSAENDTYKAVAISRAAFSGDFNMPRRIKEYKSLMAKFAGKTLDGRTIDKQYKPATLRAMGIVKNRSIFGRKYEVNQDWDTLYKELWAHKDEREEILKKNTTTK